MSIRNDLALTLIWPTPSQADATRGWPAAESTLDGPTVRDDSIVNGAFQETVPSELLVIMPRSC
jgi:hypothetical protein